MKISIIYYLDSDIPCQSAHREFREYFFPFGIIYSIEYILPQTIASIDFFSTLFDGWLLEDQICEPLYFSSTKNSGATC